MGVTVMKSTISKKAIVASVFAVLLLVCCIGYVIHLNGNTVDFSDTELMVVVSGSMDGEPRDYEISTIPVSSLIFIHKVSDQSDYASYKIGDVLTFNYVHPVSKESMVVTHRIIDIKENSGVYTYTLKGDSIADDPTNGSVQIVTSDSGDIVGKTVGVSYWLGLLVVFLSSWVGKACLVIIPCVILIAAEASNIIRITRMKDNSSEETKEGD